MKKVLPQQRLLLELIVQSGDIAVPAEDNDTVLYRTLMECKDAGWLMIKPHGSGFNMASITDLGRQRAE